MKRFSFHFLFLSFPPTGAFQWAFFHAVSPKIHIKIETKILDEGRKFYGNITINLELPVNTSAAADLEQSGCPMEQCACSIWKCDG